MNLNEDYLSVLIKASGYYFCDRRKKHFSNMSQMRVLKQFSLICALGALLATTGTLKLKAQDAAAPAAAPAAAAPAAGGDAALIEKGTAVFAANCKQCHAVHEQVVGPALKDVEKRWPSEAALIKFIKYPQKTIDGGDAYAKGLYEKYKQYMPNHDFLSDDDIKGVLAWIKAEAAKPPVAAAAAPGAAAGTDKAAGETMDGGILTYILVALLVVLVLILAVLAMLTSVLSKYLTNQELSEDDREFVESKVNWGQIFASPAFKALIAVVFVVVIAKGGFDALYGIGIQQGYAPTQPIPFSHKLHAGMYKIDCNYCHTGVNKGKSATIPAVNVCMNCHNAIKTESDHIKKIWRAVENNEPIQWVRIHNLPDLAYFNHAQHVNVGKIECQTCHGPIQEMEVVKQHSPLTMGWCINCHRETVVKTEGNAYYDNLVKVHNASSKEPMKVENIGGLECSKCHY